MSDSYKRTDISNPVLCNNEKMFNLLVVDLDKKLTECFIEVVYKVINTKNNDVLIDGFISSGDYENIDEFINDMKSTGIKYFTHEDYIDDFKEYLLDECEYSFSENSGEGLIYYIEEFIEDDEFSEFFDIYNSSGLNTFDNLIKLFCGLWSYKMLEISLDEKSYINSLIRNGNI